MKTARKSRAVGFQGRLICISRSWCTLLWFPTLSAERRGAKNEPLAVVLHTLPNLEVVNPIYRLPEKCL
jgi:hypothetical protein